MRKFLTGREEVLNVPLPSNTKTYTTISNKEFIETFEQQIENHGFIPKSSQYFLQRDGKKMMTKYFIEHHDSELGIQAVLVNSYDKSLSAKIAVGAVVWACENGCIRSSDYLSIRKHTGDANGAIFGKMGTYIQSFGDEFQQIYNDMISLKNVSLTNKTSAELVGRMFMDEKIINLTQLGVIKNQSENSVHFKDLTGWSLYNWVTESLKDNIQTKDYIDKHIALHKFLKQELIY